MDREHQQDEKLLRQLSEGNEITAKQLFHSYWGEFGGYFHKAYGLDDETIRDIYSASFATLCINAKTGKLQPPLQSSLKTYLFGIGHKKVRQHFDKQKRNKEVMLDNWHTVYQNYRQNPDTDSEYSREAMAYLVEKLLGMLDEGCQNVLTLTFMEENADDAIMEKLNIASTGAVRQRRFKCIEKLRVLLNKIKNRK